MPDDPRLACIEALQAVASLVRGVAHDVNNPLAAILGAAFMLKNEEDPQKRARMATIVHDQAAAASELIQAFEQVTSDSKPRLISVAVDELVVGAALKHGTRLAMAGVTLERDSAPGLMVSADPDLVGRALAALIRNAEAATEGLESRVIRLAILAEPTVTIQVMDTGPGIPEADRDLAFDPTFTTRRSGRGVGLGLPTALSILRRHGGDVQVIEGGVALVFASADSAGATD